MIASPADIPISLAAILSTFLSDAILAGVFTSTKHRILARIVAIRMLSNAPVLLARCADDNDNNNGHVKVNECFFIEGTRGFENRTGDVGAMPVGCG